MYSYLPALVLLGLLVVSCNKKSKTDVDALTLGSATLQDNAAMKKNPSQIGLSQTVSIDYPLDYPETEVLKNVRRVMLNDFFPESDSIFEDPDGLLIAYVDNYKQFFYESESTYADMEDEESMFTSFPWSNNQKTIVRYNDDYLFSYTVEIDRFSGGAHGEHRFVNSVVDLTSGKKITEDDLFTEKAKAIVASIIIDKIKKQNKLNSVEALTEIGYFDLNEELSLNTNFYITKKGITYMFNEYEIAGYAVGYTEVTLDFDNLTDCLKAGSPLARLIND